jgi:hypothetical protein
MFLQLEKDGNARGDGDDDSDKDDDIHEVPQNLVRRSSASG